MVIIGHLANDTLLVPDPANLTIKSSSESIFSLQLKKKRLKKNLLQYANAEYHSYIHIVPTSNTYCTSLYLK
jgi:hypothetical protein